MRESQSAVAAKPFCGCWLCSQNLNISYLHNCVRRGCKGGPEHARVFKGSITHPPALAKGRAKYFSKIFFTALFPYRAGSSSRPAES
jgi:hypothetical protein